MSIENLVRESLRARAEKVAVHHSSVEDLEFGIVSEPVAQRRVRTLSVVIVSLALFFAALVFLSSAFFDSRQSDRFAATVASPEVAATIDLGRPGEAAASDGNSVWVSSPDGNCDGTVLRVDSLTNQLSSSIPFNGRPGDMAFSGGFLWIEGELCSPDPLPGVVAIDPSDGGVVHRITLDDVQRTADIVGDSDAVWITGSTESGGVILKIDSSTGVLLDRIAVAGDPRDAVLAGSELWVLTIVPDTGDESSDTGLEAVRVDTLSGSVSRAVANVVAMGGAFGRLWVVREGPSSGYTLVELDATTGEPVSLPIPGRFLGFAGEHGTVGTLVADRIGVWAWTWNGTSRELLRVRETSTVDVVPLGDASGFETWPVDAAIDANGILWVVTPRALIRIEEADSPPTTSTSGG